MKRDEYLELYQERVKTEIENGRRLFSEGLILHAEQLKAIVVDNFRQIKDLAIETEKEYIMFFYFSLLKTEVLNRRYTIISQSMDNRWYLDEEMIETRFELNLLFEPINKLWDFLLAESQKSLGRVNHYDVQHIIFSELELCNNAIAHFLRYLLKDLETNSDFKEIPKIPYWIIRWGEYRDTTQIVMQMDRGEKTQKEWNRALKNTEKQKEDLANSYWYSAKLKECECENLNMQFIIFEECQIERIIFRNSDLSEAKFINTHLVECSFFDCDLQGVDFRKATIEHVDFQGANLKNAQFSLGSLLSLRLTPEQLQDILVDKEEQDAFFQNETR